MEEKGMKKIEDYPSKNLKMVMNLIDTLIAGKRFGEMDSKQQIYLMSCQTKIREMQEGYFDEAGISFLYDIIVNLSDKLTAAIGELGGITKRLEEKSDEFVQ